MFSWTGLDAVSYRVTRVACLRASATMQAVPPATRCTPVRSEVLVYSGEGAGARSVASAVQSLRTELLPQTLVREVSTLELLGGKWLQSCATLVMPGRSSIQIACAGNGFRTLHQSVSRAGGADSPYCRDLNGKGNTLISGRPTLYSCTFRCYSRHSLAEVHADISSACQIMNRLASCFADYVRGGGSYLGLCAGAYYACAHITFEPGSR